MQRRCNHAFPTVESLCFLHGPYKVVLRDSAVEKNRVEFRDASHPGYEFGIELSRVFGIGSLQNNVKKAIRLGK
jgi:hypothetical protein